MEKGIKRVMQMTCNHIWFFNVFDFLGSGDLSLTDRFAVYSQKRLFDRNLVEFEFEIEYGSHRHVSHILRCGVHAECICPLVQHLSTNTLPPTSIPAFPICSISNTVTPSPHLLNSLEGFHDLSWLPCTSPMGRNYPSPQPQVIVPDDASHISLPSSIDLPNNLTDMLELCLGLHGLGIGSTVSEGFHLGSSSMAHNFDSDDDSDFNL